MSIEQDPREHAWLIGKIQGVTSILEVGCGSGESLRSMAASAAPGAKIRAIDDGKRANVEQQIERVIDDLRAKGFDAKVMFADSRSRQAIEFAKEHGPYDFVFIDASHVYEDVKKDYENYGPLGKRVGLHDIAFIGTDMGVERLWKEISPSLVTQECIMTGMGVGIIVNAVAAPALQAAE